LTANVVRPHWAANSAFPNTLVGFEGPFRAGKGHRKRGGKVENVRRERERKDGINTPVNKFLVTALNRVGY